MQANGTVLKVFNTYHVLLFIRGCSESSYSRRITLCSGMLVTAAMHVLKTLHFAFTMLRNTTLREIISQTN